VPSEKLLPFLASVLIAIFKQIKFMENKILIFCILSLFLAACSKPASEEIGFGHFEGNRYFNEYFGFQINFPKAWSIEDPQANDALYKRGGDFIAGENENLKAAFRAAEHISVNLFGVFKFMPGSPVDSNPSIGGIAERLEHAPGIKTGSDYLFHVKNVLSLGSFEFNYPKEIYTENLDGNVFYVLESNVDYGVVMVNNLYYVSIVKGYALVILLTYVTEAEKSELLDVIETIAFSQRN